MAKQTQAFLTFAVTIPQPKGLTIPQVRAKLLEAVKGDLDITDVKIHLTNKEVKYGA